jgi:hypothetical protein
VLEVVFLAETASRLVVNFIASYEELLQKKMDLKEWDDEEDRENEDGESYEPVGGRDGLIFLIDATKPMFSKDELAECPFGITLQVR